MRLWHRKWRNNQMTCIAFLLSAMENAYDRKYNKNFKAVHLPFDPFSCFTSRRIPNLLLRLLEQRENRKFPFRFYSRIIIYYIKIDPSDRGFYWIPCALKSQKNLSRSSAWFRRITAKRKKKCMSFPSTLPNSPLGCIPGTTYLWLTWPFPSRCGLNAFHLSHTLGN